MKEINAALTFEELYQWFYEENIIPEEIKDIENEDFIPFRAAKGALSAVDGGMFFSLNKNNNPAIPPESLMDRADLVCEGIITLGAVSEMLLNMNSDRKDVSAASKMLDFFLNSDRILFLVGTRINEFHQDPTMPVELEIRRNVIKKIASALKVSYLKEVSIRYI
jgi:hypothetical protein